LPCNDGETACNRDGSWVLECKNGSFEPLEHCNGLGCRDGVCRLCEEGKQACGLGILAQCEENKWVEIKNCEEQGKICDPVAGCVACKEGSFRCKGNIIQACMAGEWKDGINCAASNQFCNINECVDGQAFDGLWEVLGEVQQNQDSCSRPAPTEPSTWVVKIDQTGNSFNLVETGDDDTPVSITNGTVNQNRLQADSVQDWVIGNAPLECTIQVHSTLDLILGDDGWLTGTWTMDFSEGEGACDITHSINGFPTPRPCKVYWDIKARRYECTAKGVELCGTGVDEDCDGEVDEDDCLAPCEEGDHTCDTDVLQKCENGYWTNQENCSTNGKVCDPVMKDCVDSCTSDDQKVCRGDVLYQCDSGTGQFLPVMNCAESGLVCDQDACHEFEEACTRDGMKACRGTQVMECQAGVWTLVHECDFSQVCKSGECLDTPCDRGTTACHDDAVMKCSKDKKWYVSRDCKLEGLICSDEDMTCIKPCQQGDFECRGSDLWKCDANTGVYEFQEHCGDQGKFCADGQCEKLDASCQDGQTGCMERSIMKCVDSAWQEDENCDDTGMDCRNAVCVEAPAQCSTGQEMCNGDNLMKCDVYSRWAVEQECNAPQVCNPAELECTDPCNMGETTCFENNVFKCNDQGRMLPARDCGAEGLLCYMGDCREPDGGCEDQGFTACLSDIVYVCDQGAWSEQEDCSSRDPAVPCYEGSCRRPPWWGCEMGEMSCNNGQVLMCGWDGRFHVLYSCDPGDKCDKDGTKCTNDDYSCTGEGDVSCVHGQPMECVSGRNTPVNYCGKYQVCVDGDCLSQCYDEGATRCDPGDPSKVQECINSAWKEVDYCASGTCMVQNEKAACGPCTPGDTRCLDDSRLLECNADGTWEISTRCRDMGMNCGCAEGGACTCVPCNSDDSNLFREQITCDNQSIAGCTDGYWVDYRNCSNDSKVCAHGECIEGEGISGTWLFSGLFKDKPGETSCVYPPDGAPMISLKNLVQEGTSFSINTATEEFDDPFLVDGGTVTGNHFDGTNHFVLGDESECAVPLDMVFSADLVDERLIGSFEIKLGEFTGPSCPSQFPGGEFPWPAGCMSVWNFEAERR